MLSRKVLRGVIHIPAQASSSCLEHLEPAWSFLFELFQVVCITLFAVLAISLLLRCRAARAVAQGPSFIATPLLEYFGHDSFFVLSGIVASVIYERFRPKEWCAHIVSLQCCWY